MVVWVADTCHSSTQHICVSALHIVFRVPLPNGKHKRAVFAKSLIYKVGAVQMMKSRLCSDGCSKHIAAFANRTQVLSYVEK